MKRTTVCWSLNPAAISRLKYMQNQLKKLKGKKPQLNELAEEAIFKTYSDPTETWRERAKAAARELHLCQEQIEKLEGEHDTSTDK